MAIYQLKNNSRSVKDIRSTEIIGIIYHRLNSTCRELSNKMLTYLSIICY